MDKFFGLFKKDWVLAVLIGGAAFCVGFLVNSVLSNAGFWSWSTVKALAITAVAFGGGIGWSKLVNKIKADDEKKKE